MPWTLIIGVFWSIFGDAITEFVKMLLDRWFKKAAEALPPPETFGSGVEGESKAMIALLDKVLELLPWHARGRKKLVQAMRRKLVLNPKREPLTAEEHEELVELTGKAEND